MISSIFSNTPSIANGMAHVLSQIDYKKLNNGVRYAERNADTHHVIVLFEYVNSGIYDTIAEIERFPGTTLAIHEFLGLPEVSRALTSLLVSSPNMKIYTRRKIDNTKEDPESLTKYRQFVLYIAPELPSLIPHEQYSHSYSDIEY